MTPLIDLGIDLVDPPTCTPRRRWVRVLVHDTRFRSWALFTRTTPTSAWFEVPPK